MYWIYFFHTLFSFRNFQFYCHVIYTCIHTFMYLYKISKIQKENHTVFFTRDYFINMTTYSWIHFLVVNKTASFFNSWNNSITHIHTHLYLYLLNTCIHTCTLIHYVFLFNSYSGHWVGCLICLKWTGWWCSSHYFTCSQGMFS